MEQCEDLINRMRRTLEHYGLESYLPEKVEEASAVSGYAMDNIGFGVVRKPRTHR